MKSYLSKVENETTKFKQTMSQTVEKSLNRQDIQIQNYCRFTFKAPSLSWYLKPLVLFLSFCLNANAISFFETCYFYEWLSLGYIMVWRALQIFLCLLQVDIMVQEAYREDK